MTKKKKRRKEEEEEGEPRYGRPKSQDREQWRTILDESTVR